MSLKNNNGTSISDQVLLFLRVNQKRFKYTLSYQQVIVIKNAHAG